MDEQQFSEMENQEKEIINDDQELSEETDMTEKEMAELVLFGMASGFVLTAVTFYLANKYWR